MQNFKIHFVCIINGIQNASLQCLFCFKSQKNMTAILIIYEITKLLS